MTLQIISAEEIIQFHDRLLRVTPGVAGMPDPGRAEAIMYRVLNKIEYEGVTDVWRLPISSPPISLRTIGFQP